MSRPATLHLEMYRGDDYVHQLMFTNNASPPAALDVSDYTFSAQIRDRPEKGTVLLATFDIDTTDAEDGIIVLSLPPAATRIDPGYWDLEVKADGSPTTWLAGEVKMSGDVTHE